MAGTCQEYSFHFCQLPPVNNCSMSNEVIFHVVDTWLRSHSDTGYLFRVWWTSLFYVVHLFWSISEKPTTLNVPNFQGCFKATYQSQLRKMKLSEYQMWSKRDPELGLVFFEPPCITLSATLHTSPQIVTPRL